MSKDELITLDAKTCETQVNITVVNNREPSLKYRNYRCEFEVIVPQVRMPNQSYQEPCDCQKETY